MSIIITNNGELYRMTYTSLGAFLKDTSNSTPPYDIHRDNMSDFRDVHNDHESSWRYGSEYTLEDYLAKRFDPSKGKNLCQADIKSVMSTKEYKSLVTQALSHRPKVNFKEMGSRISVPRAITGEDTYFVTRKNASRPTVKIGINMCVSAMVDDEDLVKIATKAIPTVYALEMAGICTEVWMVALSQDTFRSDNLGKFSMVEVKIKSAQERFNWTTFAPVFCSGTYRHGIFLTWLRQAREISGGYGRPMHENDIERNKSFGYTSIIGNTGPGAIEQIKSVFSKK